MASSVAMKISVTSGEVAGRDMSLLASNSPTTDTVLFTSIERTTAEQGRNDANAGLAAGVAVGVVLAVAVVVVVVAAIVLAAVCSVRRRRKYDLSCNGTYEVPYDAYIG